MMSLLYIRQILTIFFRLHLTIWSLVTRRWSSQVMTIKSLPVSLLPATSSNGINRVLRGRWLHNRVAVLSGDHCGG